MTERVLREQLLTLLRGGEAHLPIVETIMDFPSSLVHARAKNVPYTPWGLVEHMRIAQWDILEFCRNPKHVSPEWPSGYWPSAAEAPSASAWDETVTAFCSDLDAMGQLVSDSRSDLFAAIPHGDGQTLLREALLVANHNSYHLGQLMVLRRSLENPTP